MLKWPSGSCCVEIEIKFRILEIKNIQKQPLLMILLDRCNNEVMIKSNRPIGYRIAAILDLANIMATMSSCFGALKNEFRMFCSTSIPDFMLVDKSAQCSPLGPRLSTSLDTALVCYGFCTTLLWPYVHGDPNFDGTLSWQIFCN